MSEQENIKTLRIAQLVCAKAHLEHDLAGMKILAERDEKRIEEQVTQIKKLQDTLTYRVGDIEAYKAELIKNVAQEIADARKMVDMAVVIQRLEEKIKEQS